jgi:transposase
MCRRGQTGYKRLCARLWLPSLWRLVRDEDAVAASLRLPWSNGMVEGQIHRLKLIKRQMYGRASFELLKLRVLRQA